MILLFWFFFLKNASDKKSGPREFQKQSLQKLQWICSKSQDKAESGVKACFSASPKVCSVSVRMERRLADCVVAPCIIHVRMELQNPQQSIQKPRHKDSVPQQAADFSNFVFCWCKTFPPPISETNYWYILIITLHPDSSPWICKLIRVIRVLATVGVKCNNFMVSTH